MGVQTTELYRSVGSVVVDYRIGPAQWVQALEKFIAKPHVWGKEYHGRTSLDVSGGHPQARGMRVPGQRMANQLKRSQASQNR